MSETLDVNEAAKLLHMHPATVKEKARRGEIPGSKPGKSWLFIREDLIHFLRSISTCPFIQSEASGTTTSARRVVVLDDLLALPTARRRKNSMTNSRRQHGDKAS